MIQLTLYSALLIFSIIFIQMNHPLAMGLMLLIQTLLICLISGLMSKTFWFSYILFLIFLGGMLVLFIYVTSLASNEMFSFSMKIMINSVFMMLILLCMSFMLEKTSLSLLMNTSTMEMIDSKYSYMMENSISLYKLYNYPINLISLLLMIYLLITMIVVVKITNLFYGPLRIMN